MACFSSDHPNALTPIKLTVRGNAARKKKCLGLVSAFSSSYRVTRHGHVVQVNTRYFWMRLSSIWKKLWEPAELEKTTFKKKSSCEVLRKDSPLKWEFDFFHVYWAKDELHLSQEKSSGVVRKKKLAQPPSLFEYLNSPGGPILLLLLTLRGKTKNIYSSGTIHKNPNIFIYLFSLWVA